MIEIHKTYFIKQCINMRAHPHYSWVSDLWICLLTKMYAWSPNQYLWCFVVIWGLHRGWQFWGAGSQPAFLFQLLCCKQGISPDRLSAMFYTFLCFLLVVLLFKMAPKCSVESLPSAPKGKKAVMCLTEKIGVWDLLRSGHRYSPLGSEVNVNK